MDIPKRTRFFVRVVYPLDTFSNARISIRVVYSRVFYGFIRDIFDLFMGGKKLKRKKNDVFYKKGL